jgi:putative copper resistance protein D
VLLFQAAGIAIFVAGFGRHLASCEARVRRLGQAAAGAAMLLVAVHYALEAARLAGELSGAWDPSLQGMVWHSSTAAALLCRLAGLLLIVLGLEGAKARWRIVAVAGALLVALAFTLTGHASVSAHRAALVGLLMIHVLIVAFWFGALWPLYVATSRETPTAAADIVRRFTAVATWLVPLVLLAGVAMAVLLLPSLAALSQPYGELLIAKVAGFTLLMGLAATNKWRLGPALIQGRAQSARRLRRSLAAEYVLLAAVLTITAVMTAFFSPEGA